MRKWIPWFPAALLIPMVLGIWAARNHGPSPQGRFTSAKSTSSMNGPAVPTHSSEARGGPEIPKKAPPEAATRTSAAMALYRDAIRRPLDDEMLRRWENTLRSDGAPLLDWTTALWALARHETPETIEILVRYVRSSSLASRRRNAVTHLGGMHGPSVLGTLVDLTALGPSDPVAAEAFRAIARRASWDPPARSLCDTLSRSESWSAFARIGDGKTRH